MAWIEKYKLEFYDLHSIPWKISFLKTNWSEGSVITLKGGGTPITHNFLNESDEVFDPIKETELDLSIAVENEGDRFAVRDICSTEQMKTQVKLYQNNNSFPCWRGYVDPGQYEEPYDVFPYDVKMICIDGLSLLRDIPYAEQDSAGDTEYYFGRRLESQIILDVLGEIGFTEFREYVNLYEEEMNDLVTDSPCDQQAHESEVFKEMMCIDVLKNILNKFNACIRQQDGIFNIYRPTEIIDTIVYGRHFTATTIKTSLSYSPTQYISRLTRASSLRQVSGGRIMTQDPAKRITSNFDTGDKKSWIKNWEFKAETYDGVDFENWISSGASDLIFGSPEAFFGAGRDGIYFNCIDNGPANNNYVYQEFALDTIADASTILVLDFEYLIFNDTALQVDNVEIALQINQGTNYLVATADIDAGYDPVSAWVGTPGYVVVTKDAQVGVTSWSTAHWELATLPGSGPITIKVFGSTKANVYLAYKNIRFYCRSSDVTIRRSVTSLQQDIQAAIASLYLSMDLSTRYKYRQVYTIERDLSLVEYKVDNNVNGKDLNFNYVLGDVLDDQIGNIIEQFTGSIGITKNVTLADAAAAFDADHSADYLAAVVVTHSGNDIIFTAAQAGTDFSGNTTITKIRGDLSGTVVNTQANVALEAEWQFDFYYEVGNKCSNGGVNYICILAHFNQEPPNGAYWDLTDDQPQKRIDTITLIGTAGIAGIANILCNGETQAVEMASLIPSISWWKRQDELGGALESSGNLKTLLHIITDEIAKQYSRTKYMINMPIQEITKGISTLNVIGNIQDDWKVDDSDFPVRNISVWTLSNCTLVLSGNYVRYTSTDVDSIMSMSGLKLKGSISKIINIRYRVVSGSWTSGQIFYGTESHGRSASFQKNITLDTDGEWHITTFDMSDLDSGGTDWIESFITAVWFDLTDQDNVVIDLDWIGFSRIFVVNRGSFDIHNRKWDLDLMEIIR